MSPVNTLFIQDAPTKVQGTSFALAIGQSRTFPGGPLGAHRKAIVLSNDDNGSTRFYISKGDPESASAAGRARMGVVFPQTTIVLETNETITIFNPSAIQSVAAIHVMEIFYTGEGV